METWTKAYQFPLRPTDRQESLLMVATEHSRFIYNTFLRARIDAYEKDKKTLSLYNQLARGGKKSNPDFHLNLTDMRSDSSKPWMKKHSQTMQVGAVSQLDWNYKATFAKIGKKDGKVSFPNFRKRRSRKSLYIQDGRTVEYKDGYLSVNLGGGREKIKVKETRPVLGRIKTVSIKKLACGWTVSLITKQKLEEPPALLPKTGKTVGIDMGARDFVAWHDGENEGTIALDYECKVTNRRRLIVSRQLARRAMDSKDKNGRLIKKPSRRYISARKELARIGHTVAARRKREHYRIANELLKKSDVIKIEDLKLPQMMRKKKKTAKAVEKKVGRGVRRVMYGAAIGQFREILIAKAPEVGREIRLVNPANTSKACSHCGEIREGLGPQKNYKCSGCGLEIDRDINAARNIYRAEVKSSAKKEKGVVISSSVRRAKKPSVQKTPPETIPVIPSEDSLDGRRMGATNSTKVTLSSRKKGDKS